MEIAEAGQRAGEQQQHDPDTTFCTHGCAFRGSFAVAVDQTVTP
jgi:hypothetical protein